MRHLRRDEVAEAPSSAQQDGDKGRYDDTPTHREAIKAVIRYASIKAKRRRVTDDIDQSSLSLHRAQSVVEAIEHRASTNRWSQEIIWASVFVGFVFDFLLWQDIFTGRFELGALSVAAERASAVVCSLAYAYVCSQLGIAAYLKRASVKRRKHPEAETDPVETAVFARAVSRESLYLWSALFVLLTGVATLGRFTQDGTTEDHSLLTLVAIAIALVIAIMAYQYHDIYAHDLRAAKSTINRSTKRLSTLRDEKDALDIRELEEGLNGSLLWCSCGRPTCPVMPSRRYLSLGGLPQDGIHLDTDETEGATYAPEPEWHETDVSQPEDDETPDPPVAEVVTEAPKAPESDQDDVVVIKRLYTMPEEEFSAERDGLIAQIAQKTEEIERLTVENRYWKNKTRQNKAALNKSNEFITRLVSTVLDEGRSPAFHRRIIAKHRREWSSLWQIIDGIVANYKDDVAPTI